MVFSISERNESIDFIMDDFMNGASPKEIDRTLKLVRYTIRRENKRDENSIIKDTRMVLSPLYYNKIGIPELKKIVDDYENYCDVKSIEKELDDMYKKSLDELEKNIKDSDDIEAKSTLIAVYKEVITGFLTLKNKRANIYIKLVNKYYKANRDALAKAIKIKKEHEDD